MNLLSKTATMIVLIIICGCRVELHHNLSESQANEILMALESAGIQARKERDNDTDNWMVTVPEESAGYALSIINKAELPRSKPDGFQELFRKESMLPTTLQEKTRYLSALCGELQQTLEEDDQIAKARVHLTLPVMEKSGRSGVEMPGTAAVFLKMIPDQSQPLTLSDEAIKALIASSIGGIDNEDVTVVRTCGNNTKSAGLSRPGVSSNCRSPSWKIPVAIALTVIFGLGGCLITAWVGLRGFKPYKPNSIRKEIAS
ncbi:hypothetical protein JW823_06890 [bacterium]|nr:hypothetical protein [candidate division CSSED10-310 bacterium]